MDAALKEYGGNHDQNQFLDSEGNLTTQSTKTNVPAGTEVELFGGRYYVKPAIITTAASTRAMFRPPKMERLF